MSGYKSLITVMAMGGVLIGVAGILVTTQTSARKPSTAPVESKLEFRVGTGGRIDVVAGASKTDGEMATELAKVRDWLGGLTQGSPEIDRRMKATLAALAYGADRGDWPAIKSELDRADPPGGYLGFLLVLAGACRTEEARPYLAKYYRTHTTRVIEALKNDGGREAFAQLAGFYRAATQQGEKFLLLQTVKNFPEDAVRPELLRWLATEEDVDALAQVITMLRFYPNGEVIERLVEWLRTAPAEREVHRRRALNSLASMKGDQGPLVVWRLAVDKTESEIVHDAAIEAVSFMKSAAVKTTALADLQADPSLVDAATVKFLERNCTPADADAVRVLVAVAPSEWRERLAAVATR